MVISFLKALSEESWKEEELQAPRYPVNEEERAATLHALGILDTPPEERFNRITRLAAALFQVPIALVSLVDSYRQWFKSCVGLNVSETPRDISFCGHAILGSDTFVVPDALSDDRFRDNPLVSKEPHIRFYAGVPLKAINGSALGTLCIIDREPRNLTKEQIELLRDLSNLAAQELNQRDLQLSVVKLVETEKRAQATMFRLQALVGNLTVGVLLTDGAGKIRYLNQELCSMLKILDPPDVFVDSDQSEFLDAGRGRFVDSDQVGRRVRDLIASGVSVRAEEIRMADGRVLERDFVPLLPEGRAPEYLWIYRDITERKRIDTLKNEFISMVSHELRTPLTSIHGSLGLIAGKPLPEIASKCEKLIEIAYRNSDRLVRLINDILDIEKIEAGRMEFRIKSVDLVGLVEQTMEASRSYARRYGVRYDLEKPAAIMMVRTDPDRVQQVITNLLSNAAKFSPPEEVVTISVTEEPGRVRVSVRDRGPGISDEFRGRVFDKFAQADTADSAPREGTGLGLSICRAILDQLGGQIGFESKPGEGSTFYFDLALQQEKQ